MIPTMYFSRWLALGALALMASTAHAVDAINKKVVVDFLNARRAAYLSGDPSPIIQAAAPDITVTMISSVVEGPAGTRVMRMPQYAPFVKEAFANTDTFAYDFKGVKARIADDGQSAKVFVDITEDARVRGLPVKAEKALTFTLALQDGAVKVISLTEKIESVQAGVQVDRAQKSEPSGGSSQTAVTVGE